MCKILSPSCLGLFKDQFSIVLVPNRKSILKIVGYFYCFSSKIIRQAAVNK